MQKIKITFCMYQIITGGIENCLIRLISKLQEYPQYEFTVISKKEVTEEKYLNFFKDKNIPLLYNSYTDLGEKPLGRIAKMKWNLKRILHQRKNKKIIDKLKNSDVVIDYFNCSFFPELKKIDVPKIGWYHSGIVPFNRYINDHRQYLENYDSFVCLTDSFKKSLQVAEPSYSNKIIRIYNPIDIDQIKIIATNSVCPSENERYFVFVARMHEDKDHLTVIGAFEKFHKKYPDAKMYFIGDGDKREIYEQKVSKLGLSKNIIFTGRLSNPFGYIKHAVANILSSPNEGLPTVLIEAACLETLNIASDCPNGPAEILLEGEAGLLYPVGDQNKLLEMMILAWQKDHEIKNKVRKASLSLNRFDIEKIASQVNNLIHQVLKSDRS